MSNALTAIKGTSIRVLNVIRSTGSFLISQSEKASDAYLKYQAKLGAVQAGNEMLRHEAKILSDTREKLVKKFAEAKPEARISIRRDLDELTQAMRRLNIGGMAMMFLSEGEANNPSTEEPSAKEISQHWFDKFTELTRVHNEQWRENLLARALAAEASRPGTVSPRVLWLLGTMEEEVFNTFSVFLDICCLVDNQFRMTTLTSLTQRVVKGTILDKNLAVSQITYRLSNTGLIGDRHSYLRLPKGRSMIFSHGKYAFRVSAKTTLRINSTSLTSLGKCIASFYQRKPSSFGEEMLLAWIQRMKPESADIKEIKQEDGPIPIGQLPSS